MFLLVKRLNSRGWYYGVSILAVILFAVYSKNSALLNGDYSINNLIRNCNEYYTAALSGLLLLIVAIWLLLGCIAKWVYVFWRSGDTGDKVDGAIRVLIAIGSFIFCLRNCKAILALFICIAIVFFIILHLIYNN